MVWPMRISVAVTPRMSAAGQATGRTRHAIAPSAPKPVTRRIGFPCNCSRPDGAGCSTRLTRAPNHSLNHAVVADKRASGARKKCRPRSRTMLCEFHLRFPRAGLTILFDLRARLNIKACPKDRQFFLVDGTIISDRGLM